MDGPRRTCVGCRRVRPKNELVRIVHGRDGAVGIDRTGSAPGRGAYVCDATCARAAQDRIGRALRARGRSSREIAEAIAQDLREGEDE